MSHAPRNAAGTLISEKGFVLCRVCMRECDTLSCETAPEYAACPLCRKPNKPKEVLMPAVPKPSQSKAARAARGLAPRVRKPHTVSKVGPHAPSSTAPIDGQLSTKDAAAQLGIGTGRVRSLVKSGRMKLTVDGVQEYAASRRVMKKREAAVA